MAKSVKEFWGPGSQREKLVEFYRAIRGKGVDQMTRSLASKADILKACDLAKVLIEEYNTSTGQLKAMLESAKWSAENIDTVIKTIGEFQKT